MGEVPAVGEFQAEDGVAGSGNRGEDRGVGGGAGVRLHVGELGAEEGLGPIDRELLCDVDVFASAVVAASRVALRVLVGEHGPLRLEHGARHEVLAGDHLEVVALAAEFLCSTAAISGSTLSSGSVKVEGSLLVESAVFNWAP